MPANTVAVVDYGMGNLRSVAQAVIHAAQGTGVDVRITSSPQDVRNAARVVLPGQGAMRGCMRELRESGLLEAVLEAAAKKPLFGVCVGMQMLLDHSAEDDTPGLGLIHGKVLKFDLADRLQDDGSFFYFVHSFYAKPDEVGHIAAESDYGGRFACAIARDNLFATQFHPEKSADQGLALYRNFLHWQV